MPDTRLCNPWIDEAKPANRWRVQGVTTRRITELPELRRTEDGLVRIIARGRTQNWIRQLPADSDAVTGGWTVFGTNVRWTEGECERITEDGQLRIVE